MNGPGGPANYLSDEVVSMIFEALHDWYLSTNSGGGFYGKLLRVTGVSKQWNRVALEDPHLWTYLKSYPPEILQKIVSRSGVTSLTIDLTEGDADPSTYNILADNVGRARDLKVRAEHLVSWDA